MRKALALAGLLCLAAVAYAQVPLPWNADQGTAGQCLVSSGPGAGVHPVWGSCGSGGASAWGDITGTLSAQTDLQAALDGKEPAGVAFSELSGTATDAQIPNNITVDLATAATLATTATTANSGDSATAFFSTGTLEAARLPNPGVGSKGGVSSLTCSGTDKLNAIGTDGVPVCGTDQTGGGGGGDTYVVLGSDVGSAASTSYQNITGLSWSLSASTRYDIECHFRYDASATTVGLGISWDGPTSPVRSSARMVSGLTAATIGGTTITGDDTGASTTASVGTADNNHADFHGLWENGLNAGTLQMRFRPETATANGIVILTGSFCKYSTY